MQPLGLEYLSAFGQHPAEFVHLAANLESDFVSLNWNGAANALDQNHKYPLRGDKALQTEVRHALRARGLDLVLIEGFAVVPGKSVCEYAPDLDAVADMGARAICAVSLDKDMHRTHAEFTALTEMAAARGLVTTTEVCAGSVRNLAMGVEALAAVSHPDFRLLIDTMHHFRFGGTVADIAALPNGSIGHVHLCDVPMPARIENYMHEALYERRAPGDGDLPLASFLQALPEDVPIGLEIPIQSKTLDGIASRHSLGASLRATRALLLGS